jgi:hypothetical protein
LSLRFVPDFNFAKRFGVRDGFCGESIDELLGAVCKTCKRWLSYSAKLITVAGAVPLNVCSECRDRRYHRLRDISERAQLAQRGSYARSARFPSLSRSLG